MKHLGLMSILLSSVRQMAEGRGASGPAAEGELGVATGK
jgi:hypothetical protein